MSQYKIGFLGYGNMAKAIVAGIIKKLFSKKDIVIYSPSRVGLSNIGGIDVVSSPEELFSKADIICLAVKPQVFKNQTINEIANLENKLIISIMAGIPSSMIENSIASDSVRVCRVMPNTPCMVAHGMTLVQKSDKVTKEDYASILNIFKSIGKTLIIEEEKFDIATAISGSGPAYVEYFIQSMMAGGIDNGLTYDEARKLTIETFKGTTELVSRRKNVYVEDLIEQVCSKGGMTIEAMTVMRNKDVDVTIRKAIRASKEKSEELGNNIC